MTEDDEVEISDELKAGLRSGDPASMAEFFNLVCGRPVVQSISIDGKQVWPCTTCDGTKWVDFNYVTPGASMTGMACPACA